MADDYSDLISQYKAAQGVSTGNTVAAQNVTPDAAADALRRQRLGGPPAVTGMQGNGMVPEPVSPTIPHPSVVQWNQDPARAAASQDDHSILGNIANAWDKIKQSYASAYAQDAKNAQQMLNAPTVAQKIEGGLGWAGGSLLTAFAPLGEAFGKGGEEIAQAVRPFQQAVEGNNYDADRAAKAFGIGFGLIGGEAAPTRARPAPPPKSAPMPIKPLGPDGRWTVNDEGLVVDTKGRPAEFGSQREAGLWVQREGHAKSDQLFETYNSGQRDSAGQYIGTPKIFVRQRGIAEVEPTPPPPGASPVADTVYAQQAEAAKTSVEDLQNAITESATFKRDPELMREFLTQNDQGPSVFLPPSAIADIWNANAERPFEKYSREIALAESLGGDVEIPMADYLAETSGKPWAEKLNGAMRAREDGVSVDEAKELPKSEKPQGEEAGEAVPDNEAVEAAPEYDHKPLTEGLEPEQAAAVEAVAPEAKAAVRRQVARNHLLKPLFGDAKNLGLTEPQMERWAKRLQSAVDAANEKLFKRLVAQVKKESTAPWKEAYSQRLAEAETELFARRDVKAYSYLRYNTAPDGAPLTTPPVKLSKALVGMGYGQAYTEILPREFWDNKAGLDVVHPDELAAELGFDSGHQMLNELVSLQDAIKSSDAKSLKEYVTSSSKRLARLAAHADTGFDLSPEGIQRAAEEAFTTPAVTDLLLDELKELATQNGLPFEKANLVAHAQELFGRMRVDEAMRTSRHIRRISANGREAEDNLLKGKLPEAFLAKQKQVINQLILGESFEFQKEWRKNNRNVDTWRSHKSMYSIDQAYLDWIHASLADMGVRIARDIDELKRGLGTERLTDFVERKNGEGADVYYTMTPDVGFGKQTVNTYRDVMQMLDSLAENGRAEKKFWNGVEEEETTAVLEEMWNQGTNIPNKPPRNTLGGRRTPKDLPGDVQRGIDGAFRTVQSIAESLDNGNANGVFNRMLINPARTAAHVERQFNKEFYPKLQVAWKKIPAALRKAYNTKIDSPLKNPKTGEPIDVIRGDIPSIILNMGNEDNFATLAEGYGVTPEELLRWTNSIATKEEWNYAQEVWDIFDELFPKIEANKRKRSGYGLKRVEPSPVPTPHGEFAGGYFPKVFDPEFKILPISDEPDLFANPYRVASAPTGFEQRRRSGRGALFLDANAVLSRHMDSVFKQLAYGQWVRSAYQFIHNASVKEYVERKMGKEYYNQLDPWLRDQIYNYDPSLELQSGAQKALRQLRFNASHTYLDFSYTVGIAQAAGLTQTAARIGPAYTFYGAAKFMQAGLSGKLGDIISKSEILGDRIEAISRDLLDEMNAHRTLVQGPGATYLEAYRNARHIGRKFLGVIDYAFVSGPTWTGAYYKYLNDNVGRDLATVEGEARRYADAAVEATQGTGEAKDLTLIERQRNEVMKIATAYFTYPGRNYNQIVDALRDINRGRPGRGYQKLLWLVAAGPIMNSIAQMDGPQEDENWILWALTKTLFSPAESIVFLRDIATPAERATHQALAGKKPRLDFGNTSFFGRAAQTLWDAVEAKKPNEVKRIFVSAGLLGVIPTGASMLGNIAQTIWDYHEGNDPEHPVKKVLTGRDQ